MIFPGFIRLTASHWYWAVAALLVSLVAIVLYYRRTLPPLPKRVRFLLMLLRGLAAIALFLSLADALWASLKTDRQLSDLMVLVDQSSSMGQSDKKETTRFARAQEYFERRILGPMKNRADIDLVYFSDRLIEPDSLPDSLGSSTAIGDALAALANRIRERNPRAAVLLSDGANNRGVDPQEVLNRLGIPVVTVGFGDVAGTEAHVVEVQTPEVVLTDQPFDVHVTLQSGDVDETVTLRLSTRGRTLARRSVPLFRAGTRTPVVLSTKVKTPGMHDLRVDVVGADGRSNPVSGRTLFVRALKGRLHVLLIGGTLDWEYTYLKRRLSGQPRIDLTSYVAGIPAVDGSAPSRADWAKTDVAVFVHPTRRQLGNLWAPHASGFMAPGHGVVFLLDRGFAPANVSGLPYPFEFLRSAVQNNDEEYVLEPLPTRQNHPVVRFNPANDWNQTLAEWNERPPWTQVDCFQKLPADADVLVRAVDRGTGSDCPGIWTRTSRGGKAVVISGGPLWRWVADRVREGERPKEYNAFWGNTIRWLSLKDETDRLAVRTDRRIYHVGEPILLDAAVYDEVYRFLDRAEVTARIWPDTAAGDTLSVFLPPGPGNRFLGHISHLSPGTYRYDGTALVDSTRMPLTGGIFRIEPYGLEQQSLGLNESVLRRIAIETGGRYYTEDQKPAFLDSLDWTATIHQNLVETPLWNRTAVLVIFIVTLTVEWFIRRRKQLL